LDDGADGGTKPLRKHESIPHCRCPDRAGDASVRCFVVARFENNVDNTAHFDGLRLVYQALTAIGKDCSHIGQKGISAHLARPKPAFIRISGNDRSREKRQRRTGMALKVELKPHERIIVGACVITNTDQRARLLIEGDKIPILREKDILTPETADTPAKLVYLAVQLMYISPDPQVNHGTYFSLLRDIVTAVPSAWPIIEGINNHILSGDLYHALKEARKLIAYEKKLLDHNEALRAKRDDGTGEQRSA
jgi:flagellar biosynthesis repressor protein FlbT